MRTLLADFKKFILRGNVLDLAVAVVVGTAFNAVVLSFANDVVMGLVGAILLERPAVQQIAERDPDREIDDRTDQHRSEVEIRGLRLDQRIVDRLGARPTV